MEQLPYLQDTLIILCAMVIVLIVTLRLHISSVLGYLAAGVVINYYSLLDSAKYTSMIAELGVILLLFVVGMNLTFEKLMRLRLYVFGFGGLQIILTAFALSSLMIKFLKQDICTSIIIGLTLAFSSTAIVMQILNEKKITTSKVGYLAISTLLMQDCAVVPLLIAIPILADITSPTQIAHIIWHAELNAIAILTIMIVVGRLLLRPFFLMIRSLKADDAYISVTLLLVLGAAWTTEIQGLSAAMGAFLAGLLIAETEFRHKIEETVLPFQGLLLALFFISIGMSINVSYVIANFTLIILYAILLMLVKIAVVLILSRTFAFSNAQSANVALLLSQSSEFAFVSLGVTHTYHLISNDLTQLLFIVVSLTMAVTPLLAPIGIRIEYKHTNKHITNNASSQEVGGMRAHVIIAGFGRVGKIIAYMLEQRHVDYIALDSNMELVKKARMEGYKVHHGDMTSYEVFKALGIEKSSLVVLGMDDMAAVRKTMKRLKPNFKRKLVIARAEDWLHSKELLKLGASVSIPATTELGIRMGTESLLHLHVPENEIQVIVDKMRRNNYEFTENIELLSNKRDLHRML